MRRVFSLACVFVFAGYSPALRAADDNNDAIVADLLATVNKATDALATARDRPSTDAAKAKIRAIGKTLDEWADRAAKLGTLSQVQIAELRKKNLAEINRTTARLLDEARRLQDVDGGRELLAELHPTTLLLLHLPAAQ